MSGTNTNLTAFTAGDLVISVYGDGADNADYALNQAAPIVLDELTTTGTEVGQLVLPQVTSVVNGVTEYGVSGEYGSASEGMLQLSGNGESLVIAGYGVDATAFNADGAVAYGTPDLGQTTSVPGGPYTVVPRVIADIGYNGTVDTSTALYNVDNENNPRSVATVNGTTFYVSGQGNGDDTTQGVFVASDGATSATPIDTSTDTRALQIYNGQLYVSRDSTEGVGGQISNYGTTLPTTATTATVLPGINSTVTLTAAQENGINNAEVGQSVNLSPENYFFATPDILYVADSGSPKEGGIGDGGLQKWVYNGSTWTLTYTLSAGLNLVPDTDASGTTGLIGLTGTVVGGTVELYATNYTITETGQTYLFGITDSLNATTLPTSESFTTLETAAPDTIIRGISFAPTETAVTPTSGSVAAGTSQSGVQVTSGSFLDILSGGTAVSTTVFSGGSVTVETGGLDSGAFIAQGATETVLGTATGDTVDGIQLVDAATASVSNEIILNGGTVELFASGAIASGLTVGTGGALLISGNATASNVVISGGLVELETANAVLGGTLTFTAGTIDITANTGSGFGDLAVISGFTFGDVIDLTSATTVGAAGSAATLTTTTSGGNTIATVSGGGSTESFIFAGTTAGSSLVLGADGAGGEELTALPTSAVVTSGTTSSGAVVTSGFFLDVLSGGTITGAAIQSSGSVTIETGGLDSGSVISAGGNETVLGSANLDQVYGTQLVSAATAVVSNETIYAGGTVDLFLAGVIANNLTVESGGTANLNGHVIADDTVIHGGTVDLQSPKATISGSLTFVGPGTLEATDISDAGYGDLAVISGFGAGDVVDETLIGSGATLSATLSGPDTIATITSGGVTETFTFAGLAPANLTLVSDGNGGEEIVYAAITPATTSVTATNTLSNAVVTSGSKLTVLSGGTIVSATILSGGSAVVSSGGSDSGSVIAAGGNETVLGSATQDAVYGTQLVSAATAVVTNETVHGGGSVELFLAGATGTGLTVDSGGTLAISGHAIASNTVISGGLVELESPKAVLSGTLTFAGSGTIEETATIDGTSGGVSFGDQAVISGFGAGDVIDFAAATAIGSAGAAATLSTGAAATLSATSSGGDTIETVSGGGNTQTFIFAGSVGADLILTSDGHGGEELTYSSTPPFSTSIPNGSSQTGLVVTSGSFVDVLSGGTLVSATVLAGGAATIEVGGTDSGSVISSGGNELVLGSANLDQVHGTQLVSAGTAIVSNETVYAGGSVELFLAGVAGTNLTVDSGGTLAISGHATATNTVISGGTVSLQSPKATLEGTLTFSGAGTIDVTGLAASGYGDLAVISGFGTGDVIDATVVGAGATLSTASAGGNTVVTVTSGGTSQSFIFAGNVSGFALGGDGHGGEELTLSGSSSSSSNATSVTSGMTEPNLVVSGGYSVDVLAGGTIVTATVLSGGVVTVQSGGLDSGSTIGAGGYETVLGSATGDLVNGTQLVSAATAVVSNEIIGNGGTVELFLAGVIANGLTVETGGSIAINGHAIADDTVLSGGDLSLQSPKATISGSLTFAGPATLSVTDVNDAGYGDLAVISGFTAGDAIDLTVFGAGSSLTSTVSGGDTVAVVTSGTITQAFTLAGTVGAGLELVSDNNGGVEIVASNTVTWAVDAEGNFDTAANWSNGLVPGATNNVVIDFANDPIVLHDSGTDTVASLTNTAGDFQLTGGSLTAGSLTNASTLAWTGGALTLNGGNLVNNGTFSIAANGQRLSVSGADTLSNSGTVLVSGGSGVAEIDASLNNTGLLSVNEGTLSLNGGGASSGYGIETGPGGVLEFGTTAAGASNTFNVTGGFFAPDAVVVAGGALNVSAAGTAIFVDTLDMTAGLLNLGGLSSTDQGSFSQTGGTLSTTGTFSVIGGGTLTGGLDTGTGTVALTGGSSIGGGIEIAGGLTVRNEQSLTWSSGGIVLAGATLTNDDAFIVTADAAITGTGTLDNNAGAAIAVYAGSGTTGIDAVVDNAGGIQVQSGTLSLNGGGSSTGAGIYTASTAVLAFGTTATGTSNVFSITSGFFASTNTELNGGTLDVSGANGGVVFVDSLSVAAGELSLGSVSPTDQGTLTQTGGLIEGIGTLTVIGGASLSGGEQSGIGVTTLYGGSSIGGGFEIAGGRTLLNQQTLNWSSGGIVLGSGTLQNDGVLFVTADAAITGTGTLDNASGAVMAVYAGNGVTSIDAYTSNGGDIQVQSGTLSLNGGGSSNASDLYVAGDAVIQFGTTAGGDSGPFTFTGGLYTAATIEVTGGSVDFAGAAAIGFTNSLSISSGVVEFGTLSAVAGTFSQTGGTLSATGFFTVNGGAQLDGGLQTGAGVTVLDGSSSLGSGLELDGGRILENTGTLDWSGGTLTLGGGDPSVTSHSGILVNAAGATLDIAASGSIVSLGSGSVVNAGTIQVTGGSTTVDVALTNTGTVAASAGTLTLDQAVSGGTFLLGSATLDFASVVGGSAALQFLAGGGTLETQGTGTFGASISGFSAGDLIDAAAVAYNVADTIAFTGGTLTVSDGSHSVAFGLVGSYTSNQFQLISDGHGGTAIHLG
jgi:autotransporter passenger strand-loop-strand repeat protein